MCDSIGSLQEHTHFAALVSVFRGEATTGNMYAIEGCSIGNDLSCFGLKIGYNIVGLQDLILLIFTLFASLEQSIFPDVSKDRGVHLTSSLLNYLLDCLHKCLVYDTHGFLDSDRFQCLMQPLVDQVLCYIAM